MRFAAFSPDSRSYVITASTDGSARVWDAGSGEPVTPALRFSGTPSGVTFPTEEQVRVRSKSGDEEWTTIWPLVSNASPALFLLSEAEILSHSRIDPDRGLMPLDTKTLRTAWSQAGRTRAPASMPARDRASIDVQKSIRVEDQEAVLRERMMRVEPAFGCEPLHEGNVAQLLVVGLASGRELEGHFEPGSGGSQVPRA